MIQWIVFLGPHFIVVTYRRRQLLPEILDDFNKTYFSVNHRLCVYMYVCMYVYIYIYIINSMCIYIYTQWFNVVIHPFDVVLQFMWALHFISSAFVAEDVGSPGHIHWHMHSDISYLLVIQDSYWKRPYLVGFSHWTCWFFIVSCVGLPEGIYIYIFML